jgi:transcriptional regulator
MVNVYEAGQSRPWQLNESPEFVDRMLQQIVAFRIPITRLEGKWKLNQNRPAEQRQRVIDVLSQRQDENSQAVADLMRGRSL